MKKFGYDISTSFNEAKANKEIISLSDSQLLRTIRDVKKIKFNLELIEELYHQRSEVKKLLNTKKNINDLKRVQSQINHLLFVPELISITMDNIKDYEHIFNNELKVNGVKYCRLICGAGHARSSRVLFISETIFDEVDEILNNGRNLELPIVPAKFNAYYSLSSTSTALVSEPNFVVVPDYENEVKYMANYVTEAVGDVDDHIELKEITQAMNRTDGMGLISPKLALKWSKELGLEYIPSQFVIRQSFLKGLVTVFDIHMFCEEENNGDYLVKSVYKDDNGNPIYKDIREVDLIISESQFKLWESYKSQESYVENCRKNKLYWGVAQYSPEHYSDISNLNYQFLQVLNLRDEDIERICSTFVNWIDGVSLSNIDYALLYLVGKNSSEKKVIEYIKSSEMWWIKSLIVNRNLIKDKYIRDKIYNYLKVTIKNACMGVIPTRGNFQYLVSDPYAYMQSVCELPITGLLGEDEHYSNYWNERNVKKCVCMRPPLTSPAEPVILNLIINERTEKWYRWCKNGIIFSWFGYETAKLAGAD